MMMMMIWYPSDVLTWIPRRPVTRPVDRSGYLSSPDKTFVGIFHATIAIVCFTAVGPEQPKSTTPTSGRDNGYRPPWTPSQDMCSRIPA